jgi:hypothetical protein
VLRERPRQDPRTDVPRVLAAAVGEVAPPDASRLTGMALSRRAHEVLSPGQHVVGRADAIMQWPR